MKLRYQGITYRGPTQGRITRFSEFFWDVQHRPLQGQPEWRPPVDVYQTRDSVMVVVELAGVEEDDLEVTLYEDAVVVRGVRRPRSHPSADTRYLEAGILYGPFRAEVLLPVDVDAGAASAEYDQGILTIGLPKAVEKIQSITVTGGTE